jgi:hypothetical protein
VATRIVNRLIQYGAGTKRPQPGTVTWWGSPYWGKILGELHVACTELTSLKDLAETKVALIGIDSCLPRQVAKKERTDEKAAKAAAAPKVDLLQKEGEEGEEHEEPFERDTEDGRTAQRSAPVPAEARDRLRQLEAHKDALRTFIDRGGVVVVPYLPSREYVKWLPFTLKIEEKDFHRGSPRGVELLRGLSAADFFFREAFQVPAISGLPDGSALQDCGLAGTVRYGKGMVVFCQLYPELFPAAWQRTKVLRILATILTSLGVGLETAGAGTDGRNLADLFYAAPALDFNPDQHTSW